jgi:sarcosine oxidase
MTQAYDVIVLGAGGMGSAAAYHLTKSGQRVLLLEQFEIDHQKGSSYGYSRIIRYSYDHPAYIALAKAVYPMWSELEADSGEELHITTGGIDFGPAGDAMLENTFKSVQVMNIHHESLTPAEANKRFPQFHFAEDWRILYQPDSGLVAPSKCVKAQIRLAEQRGATVHTHTPVLKVTVNRDNVDIQTAYNSYTAAKLIITAGAWARTILTPLGLDLPLTPLQTQEAYFQPDNPSEFEPSRFPVFIAHIRSQFNDVLYGLPSYENSGVKVGIHGGPRVNHPSEINYTPDPNVIEKIRIFTGKHIPGANGPLAFTRVCLYTMTPDEHFIIDKHPEYPHVVFAAGFSGHGFKFSTLVGKIVTELALTGSTEHDISLFSAARFAKV